MEVIVQVILPGNDLPEIMPVLVAPGVVLAAPPNAIVVAPVVVPPGAVRVVLPPVGVPSGIAQVLVPVVAPPGVAPVIVPQVVAAPGAPASGNAGFTEREGPPQSALWMLGGVAAIATAGLVLVLAERRLSRRRFR